MQFYFRDEVLEEIHGELWLWRKTNSGYQTKFQDYFERTKINLLYNIIS